MFTIRYYILISLLAGMLFGLTSCSDSTSSNDTDASEVPDLPSFNKIEMQTEAFQGGSYSVAKTKDASTDKPIHTFTAQIADLANKTLRANQLQSQQFPSYTVASTLVIAFENFHRQNISFQNNFLSKWSKDNAEQSGDEYVWSYDVQNAETGETFSIEIRVSTNNEEANWVVIGEVDAENFQLSEQQIMEGTTALDGNSGDWNVTLTVPDRNYNFQSSSSWTLENDNVAQMEFELTYNDTQEATTIEAYGKYEVNDDTARLYDAWIDAPQIQEAAQELPYDIDLTSTFEVEWDLNTEAGSITIGEDTYCWDENRSPSGC